MLNLKKTAVAVLALGSSAVFAGTMGPVCTPGSVTVPCERMAWDFGVQALYLQPVVDHYAGFYLDPLGGRHYNEIEPDWDWGFRLEASYHFGTGNDLNVNWYHFKSDDNHSSYLVFSPEIIGTPGTPVLPAGNYPVSVSAEPEWDAVNVELGQHVDFGEFKDIRFHGGVQFVRIEHELNVAAFPSPVSIIPAGTAAGYTRFHGFGPRIGADMNFNLGNGLAIYGKGASALLIGESKFRDSVNALGTFTGTGYGERDALVPELEARLGVAYTYAMPQGDVTLDVGYMWINYFNAQHTSFTSSDFALHGPYAGLKWVGNV
ncbi:Lpg1974 family pore-forming outer membrane protein [Legionella sp. CNM-1927-20]|uniref:Lpg1974 family pore-forming outer membrane protein n=1 Tax=Legionella sp. CNM-1927-20 TaxID=3422221 RepID=UPI00403ADE51